MFEVAEGFGGGLDVVAAEEGAMVADFAFHEFAGEL